MPKTSEIDENPYLASAHQRAAFKRKQPLLLRSLSTSGGDYGDPSQPSSSESVNGKSASPSRGSSESRRFVAASLPSAVVNIPQRVPSQQFLTEKDGKSASPNRGFSESGRFVAASLPFAVGNFNPKSRLSVIQFNLTST